MPMVETYLEIARGAGLRRRIAATGTGHGRGRRASADGVFQRLGLRGDGRVVATEFERRLRGGKALADRILRPTGPAGRRRLDHDVLVMCGPKEREIARRMVPLGQRPRVFSMADQPMDLGTAKACIRRCRLMVSTDSGPRHVAAAFGLPVVTMFGPMLPIWSENPTQQAVNLLLDLDCIGCHKRVCPLGHHRCMRDLSVEMVFTAATSLL